MKTLTEADIIRIMREEWSRKVEALKEQLDIDISLISPELKLTKDGILYTVDSVGAREVVLVNPVGEKFIVSKDELEDSYKV